ncbi:MAG: Holliday junction branch migration protein RuvA [Dehalococcoidia bacterium]|nr:Holliday junction branch migration protein RuvA [Dehalococcoidia bacterium]
MGGPGPARRAARGGRGPLDEHLGARLCGRGGVLHLGDLLRGRGAGHRGRAPGLRPLRHVRRRRRGRGARRCQGQRRLRRARPLGRPGRARWGRTRGPGPVAPGRARGRPRPQGGAGPRAGGGDAGGRQPHHRGAGLGLRGLRGRVGHRLDRGPAHDRPLDVVLAVGGVGLRVHCSPTLAARAIEGDELSLHTHMHLREDIMALYGFESKSELAMFESLINVSGVGPKVGLALLSTLGAERLGIAIGNSDLSALTRVPGIGKKTAERIIVELREKFRSQPAGEEGPVIGIEHEDVAAALISLGYSAAEAADAARRVNGSGVSTEERIVAALRLMDAR